MPTRTNAGRKHSPSGAAALAPTDRALASEAHRAVSRASSATRCRTGAGDTPRVAERSMARPMGRAAGSSSRPAHALRGSAPTRLAAAARLRPPPSGPPIARPTTSAARSGGAPDATAAARSSAASGTAAATCCRRRATAAGSNRPRPTHATTPTASPATHPPAPPTTAAPPSAARHAAIARRRPASSEPEAGERRELRQTMPRGDETARNRATPGPGAKATPPATAASSTATVFRLPMPTSSPISPAGPPTTGRSPRTRWHRRGTPTRSDC